jgi:hypothetical protein
LQFEDYRLTHSVGLHVPNIFSRKLKGRACISDLVDDNSVACALATQLNDVRDAKRWPRGRTSVGHRGLIGEGTLLLLIHIVADGTTRQSSASGTNGNSCWVVADQSTKQSS